MSSLALLFTDIVDSTHAVERLGDAAATSMWTEHDARARALLRLHGGREVDRTDGFFVLFDAIEGAVAFALGYQEIVAGLSLRARIGIHVGEVHLRSNSSDDISRGAKPIEVEGLAKPLAARIMSLAQAGQTLMTATARSELGDRPPDVAITRHGFYRLKGIESPFEIFEVSRAGAATPAPPPDSEKAYRVVRQEDRWQPAKTIPNNLASERDAFVGRSTELRALAALLEAGTRLLTVTGSGGCGKTRAVRRYARDWIGDWPGGVFFCDLSECRSPDAICFAVASALQLQLGRSDAVGQIGDAIAGRGRCLVILDNFEQVVEHADATVGQWLDRSQAAAFVATSRERLHLNGEAILPLEPLPVDSDSIELFCVRAAALRPGFALTQANRQAIMGIVRLLDGLPLAIELAAARISVLSPAQLLDKLKDRFRLLSSHRPAAGRQATLRSTIDWSWTLLTPLEQAALAQCSIFEGGFDLAAAEHVIDVGASSGDAPPLLEIVQSLVEKSLLRAWIPTERDRYEIDEPFFGMYVSIREYSREKLQALGAAAEADAAARHGTYFAAFGADAAIESLSRRDGVRRRHLLVLELDNLVAACRRALGRGAVSEAVATFRAAWEVLELRGPIAIALELGRQLLALPELAGLEKVVALATTAFALQRAGRTDDAVTFLQEALALSRSLGETKWQGRILGQLGTLKRESGQVDEAEQDFIEALALHRRSSDRRAEGASLGNLGNLYMEKGMMQEARLSYDQALAIDIDLGNRRLEGSVHANLGLLNYEQGQMDAALAHYEQALSVHREVGSRSFEGLVLSNLGLLRFEQGEPEIARRHYEAALEIHRSVGNRRDEGIVLHNLGRLHAALGAMTSAQDCFDAALAIARDIRYLRLEGGALGEMGTLLASQGRVQDARQALESGAAILTELGDRTALGKLLCERCKVELGDGKVAEAHRALLAAQEIADATMAGPKSELGSEIRRLAQALSEREAAATREAQR